jgi:glycosyltransferase involved in cell wall biosynthesis
MSKIKATVSITTYNHEKYIAQAIESVLMQETNFDYEILIGEDDSKDKTRTIVKDYKRRFPDKIKIFLNDRKNVIYVNGKVTGRWNFVNNLKQAEGEYIALLDGDDFWTDPNKLQTQIDFMDKHPECAICFHNVTFLNEDGVHRPWNCHPSENKEIFTLEDLLSGNFMHTCSVIFRKGLFEEFPEWFYRCPMGDWPLHILNAQYGDIGYIDQIMGTYRVHGGGTCSSISRTELLNNTISAAEIIKHCLNQKHKKIIINSITHWHLEIVEVHINGNDFKGASIYAKKCLPKFKVHGMIHWKLVIKLILIGYFPMLFKYLLSVKSLSPEFCTAFDALALKMNCSAKSMVTGTDSYLKHSSNA